MKPLEFLEKCIKGRMIVGVCKGGIAFDGIFNKIVSTGIEINGKPQKFVWIDDVRIKNWGNTSHIKLSKRFETPGPLKLNIDWLEEVKNA